MPFYQEGMLPASWESCNKPSLRKWRGDLGLHHFVKLLADKGVQVDGAVAAPYLRQALVGVSAWPDAAINAHVEDAAECLIAKLAHEGRLTQRFETFQTKPQPARHAVQYSEGDRSTSDSLSNSCPAAPELEQAFRLDSQKYLRNDKYSDFVRAIQIRRASGMRTREYFGVYREDAE